MVDCVGIKRRSSRAIDVEKNSLYPVSFKRSLARVEKLRLNDPSEYMNAIKAQRDASITVLNARPDYQQKKQLGEIVAGWNGEQLLFVAALAEARKRATNDQSPPPDYSWISDVLFVEEIRPIAGQVKAIEAQIAEGESDLFAERTAPVIGQVARWRSVAPRDVGEVLERLKTEAEASDAVQPPE